MQGASGIHRLLHRARCGPIQSLRCSPWSCRRHEASSAIHPSRPPLLLIWLLLRNVWLLQARITAVRRVPVAPELACPMQRILLLGRGLLQGTLLLPVLLLWRRRRNVRRSCAVSSAHTSWRLRFEMGVHAVVRSTVMVVQAVARRTIRPLPMLLRVVVLSRRVELLLLLVIGWPGNTVDVIHAAHLLLLLLPG